MPTLKLQVRRDTASNWTTVNPEILPGEIGFELDTGKIKIGRTSTQPWNSIPYISMSSAVGIADVTNLTTTLDGKASTIHLHDVADINNLSIYLDEKSDVGHVHDTTEITNRFGRIVNNTNASGSINLNTATGDFFVLTLTGNVTITASGLSTVPTSFTIRIIQGGAGGYTVTWDSMFKFPNNTAPTLGTAVGDVEWFSCEYVSSGRVEMFKADGPYKA